MQKFLPKFLTSLLLASIVFSFYTPLVTAAVIPTPTPSVATAPDPAITGIPDDSWVIDKEVTFVGKNAARSGLLLDWTLQDYKWASVSPGAQNPLISFWIIIRNIVYALFILFIIATAFILVTTRGRSLSAKRFLPRFIAIILLVTFSFALIQFLYQITDGIQGFFLRTSQSVVCPPECISQKDLFFWSWKYEDFIGLRKIGDANNESAYISLILTKLSALTYYVMIGILIVRKVILWFFIIVSPIFPLLLLYYPVRNTAKIWIGEFFRWLFYAPLFAVFLAGLVSLWKQNIPMRFLQTGGENVYPTAVNILLAGPQQSAAFNNSVNLTDTYALYLVALLMLWVVIILPFILLQIFLDYLSKLSLNEAPGLSQILTMINKRFPPSPSPIAPVPTGPTTTGLARALPFRNRFQMPKETGLARQIPTATSVPAQVTRTQSLSNNAEVLKMTNIAVPTMRDIAKFESARLQKDTDKLREITMMRENLEKIANPSIITNSTDKEKFSQIRDSLIKERDQGNQVATSILKAAESLTKSSSEVSTQASKESSTLKEILSSIARPEIINSLEKEKYVELREHIEKESQKGNSVASSVLTVASSVSQLTTSSSASDTTTVKEIVRQLAMPSSLSNAQNREQLTNLKDQLIKEKDSNILAKEVLSTIEKVTSSATKEEKEQQITILKEKLLQEANKGDDLALSLLRLVQKESAGEDIEKLKERLTKAKEQGDPLATTLLDLMAQKEAQKNASPATASRPTSLPTTNRIQQVSLDDYEAVKDMWVDNYQNLDVPQSLGEDMTRDQWIIGDMAQIEDTINLLSSSDQESIDKGMEEVSNILPFLLIGGFSQSEITAYLKAKLEAGKEALRLVKLTQSEEDDTLLEVRKTAQDVSSKTMTTTTHASIPTPSVNSNAADNDEDTHVEKNSAPQNITINVFNDADNSKILSLANISIPKMVEIANYEAMQRSGGSNDTAKSILNTVSGLANPNAITDPAKRSEAASLRELLIKESNNGNILAGSIMAASGVVDKEKAGVTDEDTGRILTLIKKLFDPTLVLSPVEREKYIDLKKKIEEQAGTGQPLASSFMQAIKRMAQDYVFGVHALFEELKSPDNIKDPLRKESMTQIREILLQEQKSGNSVAESIIKSSDQAVTIDTITSIKTSLLEEKEKGDPLAGKILDEFPAIPAIDIISARNIKKLIDTAILNKDPLAVFIKTFLLRKEDISGGNILLPESNKIQQVSFDDYEAVKKLWIEYYKNTDSKENMSELLSTDEKVVTDAINLLAAPDKKDIELGMEKVASILPFLLIGGFSQAEVVSYLKAKLEAIKTVKDELSSSTEEVEINKSNMSKGNAKTAEQEIEEK